MFFGNPIVSETLNEDSTLVTVVTQCPMCEKTFQLRLPADGYYAWRDGGQLIQNAMPEISPDIREQLQSGYDLACRNEIFSETEEQPS